MTSAADLHGAPHVERYLATDGEDGFEWRNGTSILILFTKGRRSGRERAHALIFREHGDAHLVVASNGGADEPAWLVNLRADPQVEVQIRGERFPAVARIASPAEKPGMWATMVEAWPDYDAYQEKASREIPVVVLERAAA